VIVRLKPAQSVDAATQALRSIQPQIREGALPAGASPAALRDFLTTPFTLVPSATGNSSLRPRYGRALITILAVTALMLLIACANIANVLLARAAARRYEVSVRVALGASRWRLVRQLLAESLLLAGAGATLGMLAASAGSRLLVQQLSNDVHPVLLDLSIDWRVAAFAIGITVAATLVFGVIPALRASAVAPIEFMRRRGPRRGRTGVGFMSGVMVTQIVLSVVSVVTAGLFLRTFASLAARELGFDADRVLVAELMVPDRIARDPAERLLLYERVREAVRARPGVADAAISFMTPVSGAAFAPPIEMSASEPPAERERTAFGNIVSVGWFKTFGSHIVFGRDFADRDRAGTPRVAIVNEAFARKFLNGASPLGHMITIAANLPAHPPAMEIVGVAADAVYSSPRDPVPPTFYLPLAQSQEAMFARALRAVSLSVRAEVGDPASLTRSVAAGIANVNPDVAVTFRPLARQINAALAQERMVAMLSGFFGLLALVLAGIGVYGVTSYAVSGRRAEIGIRMALGAAPVSVVRLVLSRVVLLVAVGLVFGVGISLWATRSVRSLLYGLEPRDPTTLITAAVALAAVAVFAGWVPAWRASRIEPAEVLRET
jgi:putative ABC transport system permease protein